MSAQHAGEDRASGLLGGVVSMVLIEALCLAAERLGLDVPTLLASIGLADTPASSPLGRLVAREIEERLWAALVRATGDSAVAVRVSQSLPRGAFGALEYVGRTSATLGEAVERCLRLQRAVRGHRVFEIQQHGRRVVLSYRSPGWVREDLAPYAAELALSSVVVIGREATAVPWVPARVELARERPRDTTAYDTAFGRTVEFGATGFRLTFDRDTWRVPMREADARLCAILEACQEAELARIPERTLMSHAVSQALRDVLAQGEPRLVDVAARVGLSARALQRRLRAEGTSYRAVLDETRLALARRYLRDDSLTVSAVAALLGYSEPSAFHRRFRRWTGSSPDQYRREALAR